MTSTLEHQTSAPELLAAELRRAREDYGRAMRELGQLQAELDSVRASAAETDQPAGAGVNARAEQLEIENANLRRWLTWRSIALEILLLGVAGISAVIWITQWWPWE
ncbi:MAG: hypothetical protein ACE149_04505 [Armatimonadota bacterium]